MQKKILHISKYFKPVISDDSLIPSMFIDVIDDIPNTTQKIFCYNDDSKIIKETSDDLDVIKVGGSVKILNEQISDDYMYELAHILKMYEPDTVFLYYPNYYASKKLLLCLDKSIKLVLVLGKRKTKCPMNIYYSKPEKNILKRADLILSLTDVDEYKISKTDLEKVTNIKLGFRPKYNSNLLSISKVRNLSEAKNIIYTNINDCKNPKINTLVKSIKYLSNDYTIIIGGNKNDVSKVEELVHNKYSNYKKQFVFISDVTDEEDSNYIAACSVYVFTDRINKYNSGYALLRVMAESTPIISFFSGVNVDGETGIISKNNKKDLAKKIMTLSDDKVFNYEMSISTKNYYDENYNQEEFYNELISLNI